MARILLGKFSTGLFGAEDVTQQQLVTDGVDGVDGIDGVDGEDGDDGSATLITTEKAATVAPTSYPDGLSYMAIATDNSWPGGANDGLVETWIANSGTAAYRIYQTWRPQIAGISYERYSDDGSTWDNWRLIAPILRRTADTNTYNIVAASTVETAVETFANDFPTVRFEAGIQATITCFVEELTATSADVEAFAEVSLNNGSTWIDGSIQKVEMGSGATDTRRLPLAVGVYWRVGTVTDSILTRLRVKSDSTTTEFDNFEIHLTIRSNY